MLVHGHAGVAGIVFPTSQGRFFEFEDRGMVDAVRDKVERGELQLYCVDSVDSESWYNRSVGPDWRIARQIQYERYILDEVLPLIALGNSSPYRVTLGCSLGGFHAVNTLLRHPDRFTGCLSMSGVFDLQGIGFLRGYHSEDVYLNQPLQFLPNLREEHVLEQLRRDTVVLATGEHDQCWNDNERLAAAMRERGLPVRLEVWGDGARHDWPWWKRMMQAYL